MTSEAPKPVTELPVLAQVLGRIPSGVFIVAVAGPAGRRPARRQRQRRRVPVELAARGALAGLDLAGADRDRFDLVADGSRGPQGGSACARAAGHILHDSLCIDDQNNIGGSREQGGVRLSTQS